MEREAELSAANQMCNDATAQTRCICWSCRPGARTKFTSAAHDASCWAEDLDTAVAMQKMMVVVRSIVRVGVVYVARRRSRSSPGYR